MTDHPLILPMALTAAQIAFLTDTLGVAARPRGADGPVKRVQERGERPGNGAAAPAGPAARANAATPPADPRQAQFKASRDKAQRIVNAARDAMKASSLADYQTKITNAVALGTRAAPDYPGAIAALDQVSTDVTAVLVRWYQTNPKARIAALKTASAQRAAAAGGSDPLASDITSLEATQARVDADFAAGRIAQAVMTARTGMDDLLVASEKFAARRGTYDTARADTVTQLTQLRSHAVIQGFLVHLDDELRNDDVMAGRAQMRIEEAVGRLKVLKATALALLGAATQAERYKDNRAKVAARYAEVSALPGAASLRSQLDGVMALMQGAQRASGFVDHGLAGRPLAAPGDVDAIVHGLTEAQGLDDQANAALDGVAKLVEQIKDTQAATGQAGNAGDGAAILQAAQKLHDQVLAAQAELLAMLGKDPVESLLEAIDEVARRATTEPPAQSRPLLQDAVQRFAALRIEAYEHGQFQGRHDAIQAVLNQLSASTTPPAVVLRAKLDVLQRLLLTAQAAATRKDWRGAEVALGQARVAANDAEQAGVKRLDYDQRENRLLGELGAQGQQGRAVGNPDSKDSDALMAQARKQADGFDFDGAKRSLDEVEVRLEGDRLNRLSKVAMAPGDTPDNAKQIQQVKDLVAKMLATLAADKAPQKGAAGDGQAAADRTDRNREDAAKVIDKLVAQLPDDVDPRIVAAIAEERFGMKVTLGDPTAGGAGRTKETKSAKSVYAVLAQVAADASLSPTLRDVSRRDVVPGEAQGGAYTADGSVMTLKGRPGKDDQDFGPADGLPATEHPKYAAKDDGKKVDYFNFAAMHEVGHAVDDRLRFMEARMGQEAYGGWARHGGNVTVIVEQLIKHRLQVAGNAALSQYVTDVLLGNTADPPPAPAGMAAQAWKDKLSDLQDWYTIATNQKVWWNQGQCDAIKLDGTIYQLAYAGDWVSYPAAARARGITTYQFRAPGEWFAELYAAFHSGKLKPEHPAAVWLSTL